MLLAFTRVFALISTITLTIALIPFVSATSQLGLKAAKISISSPDGLNDVSFSLKEPEPVSEPLVLAEKNTLKLTFTVIDSKSGQGVQPTQAHLLFEDLKTGVDVTLPIAVKDNGKASFSLNSAKAPPALLASSGNFDLTLILSAVTSTSSSSSSSPSPLLYPLGSLVLPPSTIKPPPRKRHDLPPRSGEPAFSIEPELFHTFQKPEKAIPFMISAVGTAIVLAPWAILLGLIAKISPGIWYRAPPTITYLFIGCLIGLEGLVLAYWIGWKLYQFLPPFLILSLVSAYIGTVSLRAMRAERLKVGGKP